jgi:hypothetical protein
MTGAMLGLKPVTTIETLKHNGTLHRSESKAAGLEG